MTAAYDEAQAILADVQIALKTIDALQKRALVVVDPLMSDVLTGGFALVEQGANAISTVLSTTFGGTEVTPETVDTAAHAALDAEFGKLSGG